MIDCDFDYIFDFKALTRVHWFQLLRGKKPVDMTDRAFESFKQWAKTILTDNECSRFLDAVWGHKELTRNRRCLVNLFPTRTRIV